MFKSKKNKFITAIAVSAFALIGTYNAVVINSESSINGSDVKFVKRLDEMYGVTTPGRTYAAARTWQKLNPTQVKQIQIQQQEKQIVTVAQAATTAPTEVKEEAEAAIQEELNLNLVEVINTTKWQQGLNVSQFNGTLTTSNGAIDSLSVSLPGDMSVAVSFAQMSGNVFEYEMEGEVYSGLMFQVDQSNYMITLTNGPLEGTRLKFNNPSAQEVPVGSFGEEAPQPEMMADVAPENATNDIQAQSFNLDQPVL